jgi:site-specific DNA-methyltransferase (adenine-specific)
MAIVKEERIGGQRLILGDCLDVMPLLGKVDAVVTDPPYGIGFKYNTHQDTPEGYGEWLQSVIYSAETHCTPGSPIFIFQAMKQVRNFAKWFDRDWRIYAAAKNFVQMRPTAMQYAYDPVIVWWVDGEKPWSAGTASRDFFVANTAPVIATPDNIERGHPCPRPLDQMWQIINQWVKPESVCLDPFMGSGTTLVACQRLGRHGIGIELDPEYFDIACRRVDQATRQPDLFIAPPAKPAPAQEGLAL